MIERARVATMPHIQKGSLDSVAWEPFLRYSWRSLECLG